MWFCKRFLFLNYFKYASRHLVGQFYYFFFLLADFRYFCLHEVTSSQAMEKETFIRCINNILHSQNLPIKKLSTDRHVSIKKLMKADERFKHIEHQFDPWHVAKGILKKIMSSTAKKARNIYQHFITFMPGGNKKPYMLNQTCSGKLLLKYLLLFTTTRH